MNEIQSYIIEDGPIQCAFEDIASQPRSILSTTQFPNGSDTLVTGITSFLTG